MMVLWSCVFRLVKEEIPLNVDVREAPFDRFFVRV
jgi:hypothetical protein